MTNLRFKPKSLDRQTIVFYGAITSISLASINLLAEKGSKVFICLAGEQSPIELTNSFADLVNPPIIVSHPTEDLKKYITSVDTWINFGGKTGVGYLMNSIQSDQRKVFEENFWIPREGSLMATQFMRRGGTIINLGSEISVSAQPLLSIYSSAKQALKVFTDSLRSELKDRKEPIEVCLVRPTMIDRPISELNDSSKMSTNLIIKNAKAILHCAESPQRDVYVGGPARLSAIIDTFFPEIKDVMAESKMKELKTNLKSSLNDFRREDGH